MQKRAATVLLIVLMVLSFSSTFQLGFAQGYDSSYQLLDQQGENPAYTLNVHVPEALLLHYGAMSDQLNTLTDFPRFVTPDAVKPIADCLRQIYPNDEDFVNGALQIVHQMTYVETQQGKYPAETLADNRGDCDIFSYVAVSIIKAGNLSVILLDYEVQKHMNIAVHLATPPQKARVDVYKITHDNVDYYIAETTGGNWTRGWRVGECPDNMKAAEATVLTLENDEEIAPGQVSASFRKLADSVLSLQVWPPIAIEQINSSAQRFAYSIDPRRECHDLFGRERLPMDHTQHSADRCKRKLRICMESRDRRHVRCSRKLDGHKHVCRINH